MLRTLGYIGASVLAMSAVAAQASVTNDGANGAADASVVKDTDPKAKNQDDTADIVVSARRRDESLQDVPVSIAVVRSVELERQGVTGLRDIDKGLVNVSIGGATNRGGNASAIAIRGINNPGGYVNRDPGVGFYVDDVYFGRVDGNLVGFMDPERVEVLRGPQGTLFGKNSTGGAIRLVSRMPEAGQFKGSFDATYASYDRVDIRGMVNVPLSDTLTARVSGGFQDGGHWFKREVDGELVGGNKFLGGRFQLRWQPSDRWDVNFSAFVVDTENQGGAVKLGEVDTRSRRVTTYMAQREAGMPAYDSRYVTIDPRTTYGGDMESYDYSGVIGSLTASYKINDNLTAKLVGGLIDSNAEYFEDRDLSPAPVFDQVVRNSLDAHSLEFQLQGDWDRFNWVGGLFYYYENPVDRITIREWTEPHLARVPSDLLKTTDQKTQSYAAFMQGNYSITDWAKLTAGVRYTHEVKKLYSAAASQETGTLVNPNAFYPASGTQEVKFSDVSPMATLAINPTRRLMVYGTVSKGFRSGGINDALDSALPKNGMFDFLPETLWSYEVGVKSRWLDDALTLNVSAFSSDYKDIQLQVIHPVVSKRYIGNVNKARIRGLEAEATVRPVDGLVLRAGLGLLDPKYVDLSTTNETSAATAITFDSPFPRTPKTSYTLGMQFTQNMANKGEIGLSINYGYKSDQYSTTQLSNAVFMPAYGLLSGRLQFTSASNGWYGAIFCNNCMDVNYLTGGTRLTGVPGFGSLRQEVGRPFEAGVSLGVKF